MFTWPTTSTALPTLTDTGSGLSSVSNVTNILEEATTLRQPYDIKPNFGYQNLKRHKISPGLHSCCQPIEEVVGLAKNGCLHVKHCDKDRHETSHSHRRHQLPVRVERVEGQGAFPQMYKTLKKDELNSNSNHATPFPMYV